MLRKYNIYILFAAIQLLIIPSCSWMSEMPEVADSFFKAAAEKDYEKAYEYVSEEFKKNTSLEGLKKFFESSALGNYKEASWNSKEINNGIGALKGSVITKDGGEIPLEMKFVEENGQYKILSIKRQDVGIESNVEQTKPDIPSDDELKQMAVNTVYDFALAVDKADFNEFYIGISKLWQREISPDKLKEIFKVFIDKKIDLKPIKTAEIVFNEKPAINEKGFLQLKGSFMTKPALTRFELSYVYEHPSWLLSGISVNLE